MKKMFIILTSTALMGSGLYAMGETTKPTVEMETVVSQVESPVPSALSPELEDRAYLLIRNSIWDATTGLLTLRASVDGQSAFYIKLNENWYEGAVKPSQAAAAPVCAAIADGLNKLVAKIEEESKVVVDPKAGEMEMAGEVAKEESKVVVDPKAGEMEMAGEVAKEESKVVVDPKAGEMEMAGEVAKEESKVVVDPQFEGRFKAKLLAQAAASAARARNALRETRNYVQAHPTQVALNLAEVLYLVGGMLAIPVTGGTTYVLGTATPLVADLAVRHGLPVATSVAHHASRLAVAGKNGVKKAREQANCSVQ